MDSSASTIDNRLKTEFGLRMKEQINELNTHRADTGREKITQETIARELCVSAAAVKGWENGKNLPALANLVQLCELLNCDADYLLGLSSRAFQAPFELQEDTGLSSKACAHLHNIQHLPENYEGKSTIFSLKDVLDDLIADDHFFNFLSECHAYALTNMHYLEFCKREHGELPADRRYSTKTFKITADSDDPDKAILSAQDAAKCHEMLALEWIKKLIEAMGSFETPLLTQKYYRYFENNYHEAHQAVRLRKPDSTFYYLCEDLSEDTLLHELSLMLDAVSSSINQKKKLVDPEVHDFMDYEFELLLQKLFAVRLIDSEKAKEIGHKMAAVIIRSDGHKTGFVKTPISRIAEACGTDEYRLLLSYRSKESGDGK